MAAAQIPFPDRMNCKHSDVAGEWARFRETWEMYETATELKDKTDEVRIATLKVALGAETLSVLKHLDLTTAQRKSVKHTLDGLEKYFKPQRNVVYERYVFYKRDQMQDETVDQYIMVLKELTSSCAFGTLTDEFVRDRLVLGCLDNTVRYRMFRETDLTLIKARDMCRSAEVSKFQLSQIKATPENEVNFTQKKKNAPINRNKSPEETVLMIVRTVERAT